MSVEWPAFLESLKHIETGEFPKIPETNYSDEFVYSCLEDPDWTTHMEVNPDIYDKYNKNLKLKNLFTTQLLGRWRGEFRILPSKNAAGLQCPPVSFAQIQACQENPDYVPLLLTQVKDINATFNIYEEFIQTFSHYRYTLFTIRYFHPLSFVCMYGFERTVGLPNNWSIRSLVRNFDDYYDNDPDYMGYLDLVNEVDSTIIPMINAVITDVNNGKLQSCSFVLLVSITFSN